METAYTPTPRQMDALFFIQIFQLANGGISPTFEEISAGIGASGKSDVHRLLIDLQARNLIRRLPRRTRAIKLLVQLPVSRTPEGAPLYFVPVPHQTEALADWGDGS